MRNAVISALLVLLCVNLLIISCAKQKTLTRIDRQELPAADYSDPETCKMYYQNWIESENELEKAYEAADKLYERCE